MAASTSTAAFSSHAAAADSSQDQAAAMMDSLAWDLILQHGGVVRRDVPTVCALLCCSKGLRAVVSAASAGQLDVAVSRRCAKTGESLPVVSKVHPAHAAHLATWVAKHKRLLRSLDADMLVAGSLIDPATGQAGSQEQLLAQMQQQLQIQQRPGAHAGLLLQALHVTPVSAAILQQLPASRLTSLTWGGLADNSDQEAAAAALSCLTGLRELHVERLHAYSYFGQTSSFPRHVLPGLQQLRVLKVDGGFFERGLLKGAHLLPPQLQELHVAGCGEPLRLGHLTALTRLQHYSMEMIFTREGLLLDGFLELQEGDELPPNLVALHVASGSVQPLLALQHLELGLIVWEYSDAGMAALLRQLTALTALTELRLISDHYNGLPRAAAAVLPLLPVRELTVGLLDLNSFICGGILAKLHGLTKLLCVWGGEGETPEPEGVAAAFQQLTALQVLDLNGYLGVNTTHAAMLLSAVASHPLHELRWCDVAYRRGAVKALRTATTLTSLLFIECNVKKGDLIVLARNLTGLQRLNVSGEPHVTSAVLKAIGRNLQQLTYLSLARTAVTDAGLHHLRRLRQLSELNLDGTNATIAGIERQLGLDRLSRLQRLGVPGEKRRGSMSAEARQEMARERRGSLACCRTAILSAALTTACPCGEFNLASCVWMGPCCEPPAWPLSWRLDESGLHLGCYVVVLSWLVDLQVRWQNGRQQLDHIQPERRASLVTPPTGC